MAPVCVMGAPAAPQAGKQTTRLRRSTEPRVLAPCSGELGCQQLGLPEDYTGQTNSVRRDPPASPLIGSHFDQACGGQQRMALGTEGEEDETRPRAPRFPSGPVWSAVAMC